MKDYNKIYDVIVVGGGMAGVCAAISSARNGAKTALIQNRPVLGGNASSEIKMHITGASRQEGWKNAMESGVILELLLRNKKVNPQYSFNVMDNVTWSMVKEQENLDLFMNTQMTSCVVENATIKSINAIQISTNKVFNFKGKYFIDATGDANLAFESGADYTIGREGKDVYGETLAPDNTDSYTMGNSILFQAKHMGKPIKFELPSWAYKITDEQIGGRKIKNTDAGYWWIEVGGDDLKVIEDSEEIRDELLKYVYGVFDYIKNSGKFPEAYDLALDWVAPIPGKRESRRVYGDYVLKEQDCFEGKRFSDAVAYGGWTMDDHTIGGIRAKVKENNKSEVGTIWHTIKDIYTIPYRCLYSRNISNLFMAGRDISASHMAFSSTRVMATCSVVGQASGTAAAIATKYGITARQVNQHIDELQQTLIKDDAYIPGIPTKDTEDIVRNTDCEITASSYIEDGKPENINGDYPRGIDGKSNCWISDSLNKGEQYIKVHFSNTHLVSKIRLRFDPNFSGFLSPSINNNVIKSMVEGMPYELVKDYSIEFRLKGDLVKTININDNYLRVNLIELDDIVKCDDIKLIIKSTYGDMHARVFEFKIYE